MCVLWQLGHWEGMRQGQSLTQEAIALLAKNCRATAEHVKDASCCYSLHLHLSFLFGLWRRRKSLGEWPQMIIHLIPILPALSGGVCMYWSKLILSWAPGFRYWPRKCFFFSLTICTRSSLLLPGRTNSIFSQSCLRFIPPVLPSVKISSTKA